MWTYLPACQTRSVLRRTVKQFVAVLLGNLLYFFLLMPHLPPAARHAPYRLDWGLLADLWVCLVIYGVIELLLRLWHVRSADN